MKINAKKMALIGLAASTLFGTSGCQTKDNETPEVYGPPIENTTEYKDNTQETTATISTTEEKTEEKSEEITETITNESMDNISPESNEMEAVYGPPPAD